MLFFHRRHSYLTSWSPDLFDNTEGWTWAGSSTYIHKLEGLVYRDCGCGHERGMGLVVVVAVVAVLVPDVNERIVVRCRR